MLSKRCNSGVNLWKISKKKTANNNYTFVNKYNWEEINFTSEKDH